jgi:succinate dehydrogenase / fumarate reductase cytochrome b subunit
MSAPATRPRPRPLSPHLFIYKPIPTMVTSILHRITGGALYVGTLLVAAWVIAAATSQDWFDRVTWLYGSWFGQLVLVGYTWALMFHMLGGIRHLIWDTGAMMEKHTATRLAWATVIGSVALTALVWAAVLLVRS